MDELINFVVYDEDGERVAKIVIHEDNVFSIYEEEGCIVEEFSPHGIEYPDEVDEVEENYDDSLIIAMEDYLDSLE